jgi:pSer/pThr/pTyr-binding forkhead associated (FHA) protein
VARADRGQFDRINPSGVSFPSDYVERRFALDAPQMRIGRSRGRLGETAPEIDLSGPGGDPAISHMHAVLERQADGSYTVRDLGSTNGTVINNAASPIGTDATVPLADGDRIHLGAWTVLTVQTRP